MQLHLLELTLDARLSVASHRLETLVAMLTELKRHAHERMTLAQVVFFLRVALLRAEEDLVTISYLVEVFGLGRSIEKTKYAFFPPSEANPDGLGWLTEVCEPNVRKGQHIDLTDLGRDILEGVMEAGRLSKPQHAKGWW